MRRIYTPRLVIGDNPLEKSEAHHARNVLRLEPGTGVEIFDDAGNVADGVLVESGGQLSVRVEGLRDSSRSGPSLIVASAVPKGDRADWMVEKLSELGVNRFVPLLSDRSVVMPAGRNKLDRWNRLAIESAKQSGRAGVMQIAPMTPLKEAIDAAGNDGLFFSTEPDAPPIRNAFSRLPGGPLHLFIGPEGGWTEEELGRFRSAGLTPVSLGPTILRIETAALSAAAVVQALLYHD
jgi:16S rRNA (uracil1498-N3)-methyltransferase